MAKVVKTKAVAKLGNVELTKEGVPDMLELVQEQIKAITKDMPKSETTSGAPDGFPFSVKNCTTVEDLIKMHSFIAAKQHAYETSVKDLGLKPGDYPCKIGKYAPKAWINDIKFRLGSVKNQTTLDELNKIKSLLENNLSEEMKFQKEMNNISDILTGLKK